MKDVAKLAGVSLGTVSAVLNGKQTVKKQNYNQVMQAVQQLGYQPNLLARSMRTSVSGTVGLIIPDVSNPYYPELARGVEDVVREAGMTLFLCNSDRSTEKEWNYAQALAQKQVDGLIIAKPRMSTDQLRTLQRSCKIVLVDSAETDLDDFDMINVDNCVGSANAVRHLISCGHRKIAFLSGSLEAYSMSQRLDAYCSVLRENGIDFCEQWVRICDYSWRSAYDAALDLLALPDPPTAIFAGNDIMAFGAIRAVFDSGLRVPNDISVCGFDDILMAGMMVPALTTVHQPKYEIGIQSATLLLRKIRSETAAVYHKELATNLVLRDSVAAVQDAANSR